MTSVSDADIRAAAERFPDVFHEPTRLVWGRRALVVGMVAYFAFCVWAFDITDGPPERVGEITSLENMAQLALLDDERLVVLAILAPSPG